MFTNLYFCSVRTRNNNNLLDALLIFNFIVFMYIMSLSMLEIFTLFFISTIQTPVFLTTFVNFCLLCLCFPFSYYVFISNYISTASIIFILNSREFLNPFYTDEY